MRFTLYACLLAWATSTGCKKTTVAAPTHEEEQSLIFDAPGNCTALAARDPEACTTGDCTGVLKSNFYMCATGDCAAIIKADPANCGTEDCRVLSRNQPTTVEDQPPTFLAKPAECASRSCRAFLTARPGDCPQ